MACVEAGLGVEVSGVVSMLWVGTGGVDGWNINIPVPCTVNKPAAEYRRYRAMSFLKGTGYNDPVCQQLAT